MATAPRSARILLVEDNRTMQIFAVGMLRRLGHDQVTIAGDGAQAVAAARDTPFDLVLMDCQLPVMDGWEATRQLRAAGFRAPIVALTATLATGERERCLAAGMNDQLTKPVTMATLEATLAHWLAGAPPPGPPPVAPSAASPGPLAFNRVRVEERFEGDAELLREALDSFCATAPTVLERLQQALVGDAGKEALRHAHTLVGSAGLVGADAASTIAARMEALARESQWDAMRALLPELAQALQAAYAGMTSGR